MQGSENQNSIHRTRRLTTMALFAALAVVLVALIHFPIFPAAAFLEYDPADIPILICGFAFGPVAGITVTVIAALIQGLTVSAQSGWYGIVMHIIASGTVVAVTSCIYRRHKTRRAAAVALIIGALCRAVVMVPANLLITPLYYGMPVEAVTPLLLPVIVPFNLIVATVNGAITFFIYKSISKVLHKLDVK